MFRLLSSAPSVEERQGLRKVLAGLVVFLDAQKVFASKFIGKYGVLNDSRFFSLGNGLVKFISLFNVISAPFFFVCEAPVSSPYHAFTITFQ